MYGDPRVIRSLARRLRDRADDIRHEADALVRLAAGTHWSGLAAEAMVHTASQRAGGLMTTATLIEVAADALDQHATEVERMQQLILAIEHEVLGLVAAARDRIAGLIGAVIGAVTEPVR